MLIISDFFDLLHDLSDPRTHQIPGTSFAWPILIIAWYVWLVKKAPKLMKNRKAYDLKWIMTVYNLFQVLACGFLAVRCTLYAIEFKYSIVCEPIDYGVNYRTDAVLKYVTLYYYLKIIDLLDTVFMVLRKKRLSTLHVCHHGGMVVGIFYGLKYVCGGLGVWVGVLNCYVHTIMYFYYLLSSYHGLKISIEWKKRLTQLQMFQFLLFLLIFGQVFFYKDCDYPRHVALVIVILTIAILALFSDFYYKAYIAPPTNKKK